MTSNVNHKCDVIIFISMSKKSQIPVIMVIISDRFETKKLVLAHTCHKNLSKHKRGDCINDGGLAVAEKRRI